MAYNQRHRGWEHSSWHSVYRGRGQGTAYGGRKYKCGGARIVAYVARAQ